MANDFNNKNIRNHKYYKRLINKLKIDQIYWSWILI